MLVDNGVFNNVLLVYPKVVCCLFLIVCSVFYFLNCINKNKYYLLFVFIYTIAIYLKSSKPYSLLE